MAWGNRGNEMFWRWVARNGVGEMSTFDRWARGHGARPEMTAMAADADGDEMNFSIMTSLLEERPWQTACHNTIPMCGLIASPFSWTKERVSEAKCAEEYEGTTETDMPPLEVVSFDDE
jgi:hypothetical protein